MALALMINNRYSIGDVQVISWHYRE